MCSAESPEGQQCGLVKNLALASTVTLYTDPTPIKNILIDIGCVAIDQKISVSYDMLKTYAHVFVDGEFWGLTNKCQYVIQKLKEERKIGNLHPHTSIIWDRSKSNVATTSSLGMIKLNGTGGRLVRPMYIIKDSKYLVTQKHIDYINNGGQFDAMIRPNLAGNRPNFKPIIEFIDIEEANSLMIAMDSKSLRKKNNIQLRYTHCELHPSLQLGVLAAVIPFPDHNQSPRNAYQASMSKQAMGLYCTNYYNRYDTLAHVLHYPERPIVHTRINKILPMNNLPSGQNCIVAIQCFSGYNQEDSIIMNQSAIERDLFTSTMTKTYRSEERTVEGTTKKDIFCKPDPLITVGTKIGKYTNLEEDGLAKLESNVNNGDIIIGKVTPIAGKGSRCRAVTNYKDSSVVLRNCTGGVVDKTIITKNREGNRIARVRIRSKREPSIGDKFASRHGQKGTIGIVKRQIDMPFSKSGITPDIIMNPHAIPSRMTVGQLIEAQLSKICSILGTNGDATPFNGFSPAIIKQMSDSIQEYGDETLFDPTTGKRIKCKIFITPMYYQKLKHIARDKCHARSTGPMVELTRQPTEGRSRDGGLRLGEMERDCLGAHGMAKFLRESMLRRADHYKTGFCYNCGQIAPFNKVKNIRKCMACTKLNQEETTENSYSNVNEVEIPYASKLFIHEMSSMNIAVRAKTKR